MIRAPQVAAAIRAALPDGMKEASAWPEPVRRISGTEDGYHAAPEPPSLCARLPRGRESACLANLGDLKHQGDDRDEDGEFGVLANGCRDRHLTATELHQWIQGASHVPV
jgi:hypothetical protein